MGKSPDAFRTISEVADWLGIQAHVLRFWESKFTQVKPIKRAGGRRYYRPNDMLLLGGIKQLLHEDGLTIKGVQKILREEGMGHVSAMSPPLDELTQSEVAEAEETPAISAPPEPTPEDKGVILTFDPAPVDDEIKDTAEAVEEDDEVVRVAEDQSVQQAPVEEPPESPVSAATEDAPEPDAEEPSDPTPEMPTFRRDAGSVAEDTDAVADEEPAQTDAAASAPAALPAFLRRPLGDDGDTPVVTDNPPAPEPPVEEVAQAPEPEPEPEAPPAPKPRILDLPPFKAASDFDARPAALAAAYKAGKLTAHQAQEIAPMLDKLIALRGRMSAQRRDPANSPSND